MRVAALYVERDGAYSGLPDVELWDEARDARLYPGPWPVVAHPPCQRWCQLAPLLESLHAERLSAGYRVGNDYGCFAAALAAVRLWGGVLEHPAYSLAWDAYELPLPGRYGWTQSLTDPGCSTEVSQSAYGHACRKRTWLYYVGPSAPPELRWAEPAEGTTAQVSAFGHGAARARGLAYMDRGKSNPTPVAFRDVLLSMARSASMARAA